MDEGANSQELHYWNVNSNELTSSLVTSSPIRRTKQFDFGISGNPHPRELGIHPKGTLSGVAKY
jgi:hypothetical protein